MSSSSAKATPFRNLALALATTLIFGGLIEGIARLAEPPPVQRQEYLWDWSQHFKDGEFYTLEKGEGYPPDEETNVDGLRDLTRPVETREGLRRIVILGDSVAFGHGVEAHEAFPQILEARLRASDRDVDVFNLALPGWSTRQERIAYEQIARKYKPNVVVLAVCLNDLAELQINLAKPPSGWLTTLFKHSAAVRLALGASRREIGAVEDLFTDSDSTRVQNAFKLFFDEVRALRRDVEGDGAKFAVVVFPFRFQVQAGAPVPSAQDRISTFGEGEHIDVVDFLPELKKEHDPASLFLDYDHFDKAGHERVAEWLSRQAFVLAGLRLIPDPRGAHPIPPMSGGRAATEVVIADAVARAVDDLDPRVRFAAAREVFSLGLPGSSSVDVLIRGVKHDDPRVRAFATWTLGEMGPIAKAAVPALVELARKDGGAGKTGAMTAIGKIGGDSPEAIPLLLKELKHPKEARRYRAARTLGRMGAPASSAIPGLIEALKDPSALVRLNAAKSIGEIGSERAKAALPALIETVNKDSDKDVRKEASLAIAKLPGR